MHPSKLILQSRDHRVNMEEISVAKNLSGQKKLSEQCVPGNEANALRNLIIPSNNKEGKEK